MPSADFIIAPHPRIANLHLATGGSAHAWKFLPLFGEVVLDSIQGKLDGELAMRRGWQGLRKDFEMLSVKTCLSG